MQEALALVSAIWRGQTPQDVIACSSMQAIMLCCKTQSQYLMLTQQLFNVQLYGLPCYDNNLFIGKGVQVSELVIIVILACTHN